VSPCAEISTRQLCTTNWLHHSTENLMKGLVLIAMLSKAD